MARIEPLPLGLPSDHLVDALAYAMAATQHMPPDAVMVIIGPMHDRRGSDDLNPALVAEFDALIAELDNMVITRQGWDRLKAILVEATLSAGDAEAGARGFRRIEPQWPKSRYYDGQP